MVESHQKSAVILAAGTGSRLRPLTLERPKCMVEFQGVPMLKRSLESLGEMGVETVTIVCGYKADVIRQEIGRSYGDIAVSYIQNERFAETNSMYSLWLAREALEQGCWILEGDVVCRRSAFDIIRRNSVSRSCWAGLPYDGKMDGSVFRVNGDERITHQEIIREPEPGHYRDMYKSSGILCVTADYGRLFSEWLTDAVARGRHNDYYDLIIRDHLEDAALHVANLGSEFWYEIDTEDDLLVAERLFKLS